MFVIREGNITMRWIWFELNCTEGYIIECPLLVCRGNGVMKIENVNVTSSDSIGMLTEIVKIEELQKTALSSLSSAVATTATTVSSLETVDTVAGTGKTVAGTIGGTGSSPMASYGSKTPMFGKIICGDCGSLMIRKTYKDAKKGNNYKVWSCKTPKKGKLPKQPTQDIHSQDVHSDINDCGSSVGCAGNNAGETGFYCSTKSVKETDVINEILRQAGHEPEQPAQVSASKGTASKRVAAKETGQGAKITAKLGTRGNLPRVVEQLLPKIKRIIIGGQEGEGGRCCIKIEWN